MTLSWQWPWAAPAAALGAVALVAIVIAGHALHARRHSADEAAPAPVFSLDDDLATERASTLMRRWRRLTRAAAAMLAIMLALTVALLARPSVIAGGEEHAARRDIVLCLDVSGSTLPYDREVLETYQSLVSRFQGERIGLSIFNSTSRTVFPLTDDYELVADQLAQAVETLRGVESQEDIDAMSDEQYQRIADWLDGTQNRRNATSLIGDGVVSCAAMLPGFAYGSATGAQSARHRTASIVLATDNVVSGDPSYTLAEALDLVHGAGITIDGLFSGPESSEADETTTRMRELIEAHDGTFLTRSDGTSIDALVREIDRRRIAQDESDVTAAVVDAPGWWTLALTAALAGFVACAWRSRR